MLICLLSREGSCWSPLSFQLFKSVPSNRYLRRGEKPARTVVGGDLGSRQPQKPSAGQAYFQQPCPQVLPARGIFPCWNWHICGPSNDLLQMMTLKRQREHCLWYIKQWSCGHLWCSLYLFLLSWGSLWTVPRTPGTTWSWSWTWVFVQVNRPHIQP